MSLMHIFDNFFPHKDLFGGIHPRHFWSWPFERGIQSSELDELTRNMHINKDGFGVKLDVKNFKPEEITVKTIGNSIIIEAKHEEQKDMAGFISRHIVRRYDLPEGYKPEEVVSQLSSDGVLAIKCPKSGSLEGVLVREIPILQVGPARLTEKEKGEEETAPTNGDTEEKLEEKK